MRRFTAICIDNKTHMRMVYSDCSFNAAAFQLEHELGEPVNVKNIDTNTTKIEYPERVFIYDELRGLLLEETNRF